MSLICESLGSPRPSIMWSHDGKTLSSRANLVFPSLTESNSGVYTCVASNLAGSAKVDFSVTVESPRVELPSIGELGNVSAMVGEAAVLQCKVTSSLPPSVQWLRKVDENIQQEATLTLANMQLVSVSQDQDTRMVNLNQEGSYLDTLVIDRVTPEDAGLYVCFATNTAGGFNYQSAHLGVLGKESDLDIDFLPVVAAALALVLLVLVVGGIVAHQPAKSSVPSSPECKAKQVVGHPSPAAAASSHTVPNFYCPPSHTASWASLERSTSYVCLPGPQHVYDLPFNQLQQAPPSQIQSSLPPPLSTPLYRRALGHPTTTRLSSSLVWSPASPQVILDTIRYWTLSDACFEVSNFSSAQASTSTHLCGSTSTRLSHLSSSPHPSPRHIDPHPSSPRHIELRRGEVLTEYHNL